jgi:hypothetical protein
VSTTANMRYHALFLYDSDMDNNAPCAMCLHVDAVVRLQGEVLLPPPYYAAQLSGILDTVSPTCSGQACRLSCCQHGACQMRSYLAADVSPVESRCTWAGPALHPAAPC